MGVKPKIDHFHGLYASCPPSLRSGIAGGHTSTKLRESDSN